MTTLSPCRRFGGRPPRPTWPHWAARALLALGAAWGGPGLPRPAAATMLGPSFECGGARDPVALVICADAGLRRRDVAFVQAFQALRHQLPEEQRAALRQDALGFHTGVMRDCALPAVGSVPAAALPRAVACVDQAYAARREAYRRRLGGAAAEEAARSVEDHVGLQALLLGLSGATPAARVDGVYGPATREALRGYQARSGLAAHGFLDEATAAALVRDVKATLPGTAAANPAGGASGAGVPVAAAPPVVSVAAAPPAPRPTSAAAMTSPMAGLPCGAVSLRAVRQTAWGTGQAPFGLAQERWTRGDYTALLERIDACMAENGDTPQSFAMARGYIDGLRSGAPDPQAEAARRAAAATAEAERVRQREERREAARRSDEAVDAARTAARGDMFREVRASMRRAAEEAAAREPVFDCADPAVLAQVKRLYEGQSNIAVTIQVLKLYDAGVAAEHRAVSELGLSEGGRGRSFAGETPAERNLVRVASGLPRCLVRAVTNHGDVLLGYEQVDRGGELFLRVRPGIPIRANLF